MEELEDTINMSKELMDESISHLEKELMKVRTGKASPAMVSGLMVEYYGSPTPLAQVANVGTQDARTITIQPWEKTMLAPIERSIFQANLGLTPQNDGELIRINVPPLTEDRRKEMTKIVRAAGEESKIGIRNARRDAMEAIKKAVKDGLPEDAGKRREDEVQGLTDNHVKRVEGIVDDKEKEVMTI